MVGRIDVNHKGSEINDGLGLLNNYFDLFCEG